MREAPSLVIIEKLLQAGANVVAYDPVAMHEAERLLGDTIAYSEEMYATLDNADALLIITEWPEFRSPDFEEMNRRLNHPVIFDGRNIFDQSDVQSQGFAYYCIGVNTEKN